MAYNVNKNTEYIIYEVQDGDTYASIAEKNNITMSELVLLNDFNALDLNTLYVGSVLKVGLRDATTGEVIRTNTKTDNDIEEIFYQASLQAISVDTVTQNTLNEIKEIYRKEGLSGITNQLSFLVGRGYTTDEIKLLLNEANLDLSRKNNNSLDNTLDIIANNKIDNTIYKDSDYSKDSILGLPFRYTTYADPRRRVFNSTFMADAPIVSIIPGKPLFRSSDDDNSGLGSTIRSLFSDDDDARILNNTLPMFDITGENDYDGILKWLKNSQQSAEAKGDLRYYRFQEDYDTFEQYLDINVTTLAAKMGVGSLTAARYKSFMSSGQNSNAFLGIGRCFKFFCTKSGTSTSESISNEFADSVLASTANSISEAVQEFHFLTGNSLQNLASTAGTKIGDAIQSGVDSVAEIFGADKGASVGGGYLGGAISTAAAGNKLIWPQIWKNSTFNRSYNLSFEFVSPYGTPEAIFRYVYLPFITLLTLATPKQYGTNGYCNPFLIRLEMPGAFTSDLAVIQNMTWRKGGNDNLFTNDGLPLAISVDISGEAEVLLLFFVMISLRMTSR